MNTTNSPNKKEAGRSRKINEAVGIDLGNTSIKVVRVKKSGSTYSLIEADVLEPVDWADGEHKTLHLDKKLQTTYAAICYAGLDSVIRYVDLPSKLSGRIMENRLRKQLGVNGDYQLKSAVAIQGRPGEDNKIIAVAVPHTDTERIRNIISGNRPSVISLEVAGLSALHTFENTAAVKSAKEAVCYIECGAEVTVVSFFVNGELSLARKFEYGGSELVARIQESLSVEHNEALSMIFDDATRLQASSENPMGPFLKQLTISRHYIERSEQCTIEKVFTSGGLCYSPYWLDQVQKTMDAEIEIWNPFENNGITSYPRGVKGVESMFAPALGSAMALLG
jgi:Tfp pilus assembly PilM family ATPase